MAPSFVTPEEFKSFHSIDRQLFSRLVLNLGRGIDESKQIIGLWLWMEQVGYPNIINRMLSLPDIVVNALADEAASTLIFISNNDAPPPSPYSEMPLTLVLAERDVSHQLLYENRVSAINGVRKFVTTVFDRAFDDIVEQVKANAGQPMVVPRGDGSNTSTVYDRRGKQMMMVPHGEGNSTNTVYDRRGKQMMMVPHGEGNSTSIVYDLRGKQMMMVPAGTNLFRPVFYPGLQLPYFGPRVGVPCGPEFQGQILVGKRGEDPLGASSSTARGQPENPNEEEVPQDERTMFMTFSKGYNISEGELLDYFTITYGDCIEAIYMHEVSVNVQPLYARVVFRSLSTIGLILNNTDRRKFEVNGKPVWARKYVPKRNWPPPPPPPPPAAAGF